MTSRKRVAFKSLGCKTNHEEMTTLRSSLAGAGFELIDSIPDADIVIVNTCCVTQVAESKSNRLLRALQSVAPQAKILVTGCLAQHDPASASLPPGVQWVVGNSFKDQIASILTDHTQGVFHEEMPHNDYLQQQTTSIVFPDAGSLTRFPLKIQEGCNNQCAYCIVPSVRGSSRSLPKEMAVARADEAIRAGYKEIVLAGTHIGQYCDGHHSTLLTLVKAILSLPGDFRVRLSSMDPRELNDEILGLFGRIPRLCLHLHVSVQSFSCEILSAMDRQEKDLQGLVSRLQQVRRRLPDLALGGDFIVGFPGETEAMFAMTKQLIAEAGFTYGHVFRFSKRPGTKAASMDQQVSDTGKRERWESLTDQLNSANHAFIASKIGEAQRIIVESENPLSGVTSNYLHVSVADQAVPKNSWLSVRIVGHASSGKNQCVGVAL